MGVALCCRDRSDYARGSVSGSVVKQAGAEEERWRDRRVETVGLPFVLPSGGMTRPFHVHVARVHSCLQHVVVVRSFEFSHRRSDSISKAFVRNHFYIRRRFSHGHGCLKRQTLMLKSSESVLSETQRERSTNATDHSLTPIA